jgi:DNA-binding MarR family transcriptional regulator
MSKSDLVSEIVELERRANRLIRQYPFDAWMEINLTVPQLKSLFFIAKQRGTNSRNLATALGVTPPNMTGIVDRLVKRGLVSRKENPEDRRAHILQVTEKGEAIITNLRDRRRSNILEILGRMNREELSCLGRGLALLVKAAQTDEEES